MGHPGPGWHTRVSVRRGRRCFFVTKGRRVETNGGIAPRPRGLQQFLSLADIGMIELWLRYFKLGGLVGQLEVEAYVYGAMTIPAVQRNIVAQALNERLDECSAPGPRVPYGTVGCDIWPRGPRRRKG